MNDTSKYENLRLLFLDFIDLGEDEEVWQRYLEIYDNLLKRNAWLEEVVALLQEEGLDLSEGYPLWEGEEE